MRDGMAEGNGYGAASGSGQSAWDQGVQPGDPHAYAPGTPGKADTFGSTDADAGSGEGTGNVPGPRRSGRGSHSADGGSGGPETGPAGGGHRRGGSRGRKKPVSRGRKVLKWTAIGTAVAVLGSAGAAYGYYEYLASKIRKGERVSGSSNVVKAKANTDGSSAMNILIIGSDSRESAADAALGGAKDSVGERADVIMIVHLAADRSNMSVVSIPRDTRVKIPSCTDPHTHHVYPQTEDIINASLGRGGAGCTLATVQNLTKVYIDHWMKIDFSGVVKMAQVVGGVEVCVDQPVQDHPTKAVPGTSHLLLKKSGKQTITDPNMALAWLRARHPFRDDAGRAKAQHMYMSSLIRKLRGENLFTNPAKLNNLATAVMKAFAVSDEIGDPKKLYDLGMQLKTVPPKRMTMLTMPHDADPEDDAHYVPAKDADTIWSLLRNDTAMDANGKPKVPGAPSSSPKPSGPPAAAPSAIGVSVVNGTAGSAGQAAVQGRAGAVTDALKTAGYTQAAAEQTAVPSPATIVEYPESGGAQAKSDATAVAAVLKIPVSDVKAAKDVQKITLTIGSDWRTGTDFAKTAPKAGAIPVNAQAINGADEGCMPVYAPYVYHGK